MEDKFQGIILKKRDVSEADRIYSVYTKEMGKMQLLGKGVRKPTAKLAGFLEPITYAEIFFAKGRGMGKITGSLVLHNFSNIKEKWETLEKVFFAFSQMEGLIKDQEKDEIVFRLLLNYLETMEKLHEKEKASIVTVGFLFKFLAESGYQIDLSQCAFCEKKLTSEKNYFDGEHGIVVCEECHKKNIGRRAIISTQSIKMIRLFLNNKIENLVKIKTSQSDLKNLEASLNNFLLWVAG